MKKRLSLVAFLAAACLAALGAQEAATAAASAVAAAAVPSSLRYVSAALAVGLACVGGGIAVGQIGSAAMGAMAENPELSGKALPYVGLAEGICLWGFLVALLMLLL
jgi:V/A-type H+-transporting ATPase subunit K